MIIVDVETTGVDAQKNSLVSIGAVDFYEAERQFYGECKPWEGAEINSRALEINGFSKETLRSKDKEIEELTAAFKEWTEEAKVKTLAGENIWFDVSFLKKAFEKSDLEWTFGRRFIDLHSLSYSNHISLDRLPLNKELSRLSLDQTLQYVGMPEEPEPHNALRGAKMEAEAFSRLIFGENLLEEFKKHEIPNYLR